MREGAPCAVGGEPLCLSGALCLAPARRRPSGAQPAAEPHATAELQAALHSTGVQRGYCVVTELPIAFRASALRPVVVVSDGLAT